MRRRSGAALLAAVWACAGGRGAPAGDSLSSDGTAGASAAVGATRAEAGAEGGDSSRRHPASANSDTARDGAAAPGSMTAQNRAGVVTTDSVRGTVAVVGAVPLTSVVLRPADGAPQLTVVGARAAVLRGLAGVEVTAYGAAAGGRRFEVREFVVRGAAGRPALDGRIVRDGAGYALALADGTRRPVAALPEALRDRVGARVYLVGPLDGELEAFGIIEEPH